MSHFRSEPLTTPRLVPVVIVALAAAVAPALLGTGALADPPDPFLRCEAVEGGVLLEWEPIAFFAPVEGFTISRDDEMIARIPISDTRYFDAEAPAGTHVYTLAVINWDGTVGELGRCEVAVEDFGLRCQTGESREDHVYLEWGPILIDIHIFEFRILRNGRLIATLPNDRLTYMDQVPDVGSYRYAVHAVVSEDGDTFLVGTCSVEVRCFGLRTDVKDFDVLVDWEPIQTVDPALVPPDVEPIYIVSRNDDVLARTSETEYADSVPGPGLYTYRVHLDMGTGGVPVLLIGACRVLVPGEVLPPPRELTCLVREIEPEPIPLPVDDAGNVLLGEHPEHQVVDTDGDGVADALIPWGVVDLAWVNPVAYDRIIITRNNVVIATLAGDTTRYVDRVAGGQTVIYTVRGVVGDLQSTAARCQVEVPPGFIPPPQDLMCTVLDIIMDPEDPDNPMDPATGDVIIAPVPVVLLEWWNPIRYDRIVVRRDRQILAELPGGTMMYRDILPPPGLHTYGVFGIIWNDRPSPVVECVVRVGTEPVPPVRNLTCVVADVSPDGTPGAAAILTWANATAYDGIVVQRNGDVLAELPGDQERYVDSVLEAGVYLYEVIAHRDGQRSRPVSCELVVPGPPHRNLLYFAPTISSDTTLPPDEPTPLPPLPLNRITCMAANVQPVQGWSFGVASDPAFVVPEEADLRQTVTSEFNGGDGPAFLHIAIEEEQTGVVMAVVIDADTADPPETLPPANAHRLLNIRYGAGPAGSPGEAYPVRYTGTLGDPPVQVLFVVDGFEVTPATRAGWVSLPGTRYIRGDADENGTLEMTDAINLLGWLFLGGEEPLCMDAANANGSSDVNIADPVYILQFLYAGGPPPPYPFPECGATPSILGCDAHSFCNPPQAEEP